MNTALPAPTPLAGPNQPVDWLFAFKFNAQSFPGCTDDGTMPVVGSSGIFGGTVEGYPKGHSQQYVFATSANPTLVKGTECLGGTLQDPLGATFAQIYNSPGYYFVVWNDQFYGNPIATEGAPWGHSKGMVAWNDAGDGMVLQVSTPSWPASASNAFPRQNDGNTLGCIKDDDIMVSQHFFALKLNAADVASVLQAMANSSVVTNLSQPSIVNNGGPANIQALVNNLGKLSSSQSVFSATLSSGIRLISKPSDLNVPPWQMVSSQLNGVDLRVASWWADPTIPSTTAGEVPQCWDASLGTPGAIQIATSGTWQGVTLGLKGGDGTMFNHAKIGVSMEATQPMSIFGDMNQQGCVSPGEDYGSQKCNSSQNGRGGMFYVVPDPVLYTSLAAMLAGESA